MRTFKTICLFSWLGVSCGFFPAVAQEASLPRWVSDEWEVWTRNGGVWTTDNRDYKSEQQPYDAFGMEWTWGLGKKSIKGRLYVIKDGKDAGTLWEYRSAWHPVERTVLLYQFGSDGSLGLGTMDSTGPSQSRLAERFFDPSGSTARVGHDHWIKSNQEIDIQSYTISEDGEWKKLRFYVWKHQK